MQTTPYAGFWERAGALVLDVIIMAVPSAIIGFVSAAFTGPMAVAVTWVYFASMESSRFQGTLGKHILGLRVVDSEYHRLTFARATGRYFGRFLSAIPFGLGFLVQPFTSRRQTWHDMLASCIVIRSNESNACLTSECTAEHAPLNTQTSTAPSDITLVSQAEEDAFRQAKEEFERGVIREGLWAKVLTEKSDAEQQRLRYIQYRASQIEHAAKLDKTQAHRQHWASNIRHWMGFLIKLILIGILLFMAFCFILIATLMFDSNTGITIGCSLLFLGGLTAIGFSIYFFVAILRENSRRKIRSREQ